MKHSFITPREKKILGAELIWLLSAFALLVILMLVSTLGLNSAISGDEEVLNSVHIQKEKIAQEQKQVTAEVARLQALEKIRERISTVNRLKKENVKNFFDLVPDGVTLELAELRDNTLRLKGTTVSKKQFRDSFQRSLESIFSRSTTKFRKQKDGTYRFNNISIMEAK